jgi:hypothetical protein
MQKPLAPVKSHANFVVSTKDQKMNSIESRLLALEKSNTRFRALAITVIAILALLLVYSFTTNQTAALVQAKKFELVDEKGNVLVRMENYKGSGAVTTYNTKGAILTDIVPSESGAGAMIFYNGSGKKNLILTDVRGGGGSVRLFNSAEENVLSLGRNTSEGGSITLRNVAGTTVGLLTTDTGNNGTMLTYNYTGTQSARMPAQ